MSTSPILPDPLLPSHELQWSTPDGKLTEQAWWYLQTLRQSAAGSAQNSTLETVPLTPAGGIVAPDLSQSGPLGSFRLTGNGSVITVEIPTSEPNGAPTAAKFVLFYDQDSVGGRPAPFFVTGPGGYSSDLNDIAIITEANTRTTYGIGFDGTEWTLLFFESGQTL